MLYNLYYLVGVHGKAKMIYISLYTHAGELCRERYVVKFDMHLALLFWLRLSLGDVYTRRPKDVGHSGDEGPMEYGELNAIRRRAIAVGDTVTA